MDLFDDKNHVEGTVAAEREKRITGILKTLQVIFDKLEDFYAAKDEGEDTQYISLEIDKIVSELIYSVEAGQFSLFSEEERGQVEALKNREINEISSYVKVLIELYSALGMRNDIIGLVDMQVTDRFSLKRDFLVKFLVIIEEFRMIPTVDNLIRIRALVKVYERMRIAESVEQEAVIMHCERFSRFFNLNIMACIRSKEDVQNDVLDEIYAGAESLLLSLKPVVKA